MGGAPEAPGEPLGQLGHIYSFSRFLETMKLDGIIHDSSGHMGGVN